MERLARLANKEVIARLADEGIEFFTVGTLAQLFDLTPERARRLAARLARGNLARRIKRNRYALLPPTDWDQEEGLPVNWYLAAATLVNPDPYFLAYYTAMDFHRMVQHPLQTVFVAVTKQRAKRRVGQVRFVFVTLEVHKFFGFEEMEVERGKVANVATLERTFVDCVDRPDLCGGLEEVLRGFVRRHADLNRDRLLRYVLQLGKPAVTKRLGFLLEIAGLGDAPLLWELERAAGRLRHYLPLDKTRPPEGANRTKRWELIINTNLEQLLRSATT
jgi:predicted transcriptional regulator of viral defense system